MRVALAVVAEEAVDPLFRRCAGGFKVPHAPFAEGRGGVACVFRNLGYRYGFIGKWVLAFGRDLVVAADG